jgi:hypothetical protein
MRSRRLISTLPAIERQTRRHDVTGEVLPAVQDDTRALVPVTRQTPVIAINLPRAHDDGG